MPSVSQSVRIMSTFLGQIDEIPGISVDRFDGVNLQSSLYFLSHCHTDHMRGLGNDFFRHLSERDKYLYCSPITRAFLLGIYPALPEERIIEIDSTIPKTIGYNITRDSRTVETYVTVTTSAAGHCPGSVMFVFINEEKSVLYTGDFRINPKDFEKLNPLNDKINGKNRPKYFTAIYLDTTFLTLDFPAFPSRKESCEEICRAVNTWLRTDEKNTVILECSASYGVEYLIMEISRYLNTKIHVKDKVYSNYMRISVLANCATNDGTRARIHACTSKMTRDKLLCRFDVNPENILTVVPSAQRWRGRSLKKFTEFDVGNRRRLYVCYSMHASYDELRNFVDYFKPEKIIPCVCPSESNNEIYRLLRKLMSYQKNSGSVDEEQSDFKLPVFNAGKKLSYQTFESQYFSLEDEDDDC